MQQNLELTGGLIVTERVALALGGGDAHGVVRDAVLRSAESGRPFEEELRADDRVELPERELAAALDPLTYLGSAEAFVDRALALYREERE
jgi:3-carboxy-cis,cis-muconate cycloisomerase